MKNNLSQKLACLTYGVQSSALNSKAGQQSRMVPNSELNALSP